MISVQTAESKRMTLQKELDKARSSKSRGSSSQELQEKLRKQEEVFEKVQRSHQKELSNLKVCCFGRRGRNTKETLRELPICVASLPACPPVCLPTYYLPAFICTWNSNHKP